jgi:hypothetical protein
MAGVGRELNFGRCPKAVVATRARGQEPSVGAIRRILPKAALLNEFRTQQQ